MAVFGEVVPTFWQFYVGAGEKGRYTLADWLGTDPSWIVLGIVLMALGCFIVVELVERWLAARTAGVPR